MNTARAWLLSAVHISWIYQGFCYQGLSSLLYNTHLTWMHATNKLKCQAWHFQISSLSLVNLLLSNKNNEKIPLWHTEQTKQDIFRVDILCNLLLLCIVGIQKHVRWFYYSSVWLINSFKSNKDYNISPSLLLSGCHLRQVYFCLNL